ncbi:hypothetical protein WJX72_005801 [[Myrmecia] bisecta]|uniref:adenylate kinase n=1 Tax=[Myrmecia] bisecta TaxID=41462 RepID=A0AAW1PHB6_9CHLO
MKAFVAECNAFILRTVGEALTAAGYEVYGTLTSASADAPSWLRSADTSLSAWALELSPAQLAEAARKEASVVVYAVHGQEQQCQEAVLQLAALPADGKERVFIGISTPLTWAKTPKPAARKGRLRTHIICPGLLYGLGETAEGWHEQFQAAWQASPSTSLPVYGSGANIVPTIHVTDLAAYVVACAECGRPDTPYLLAVDQKLHSLREIVAAISGKLGSGLVHEVPQDELFVMKGIERYLLELPMSPTHLPLPPTLHYHDGLLANLDTIAQQYLAARQLAPMKVLLAGPPAAGKTYWADKLAAEYQLRRIDARAMLTAAEELGPAFKQEVQTELSGKGGRASDASLARICQHLLRRLPERNRGYVLDGWPRTAEQAEEVFSMDVPYTEEELRAWESEKANEAAAKGPPAKAGAKGPAAAQKGGKAASIQGPPRRRAVQQELLPDVVFQLDAPEEVLLARVQQVAGVEAAAASPPPPPPAVKGGKAAAPPAAPLSHNNEPGFRRRFAAYTALHETDSQDLHNRQEAIQARWEDQRKALEAKAQAEAETAALAELRQRRKSTLTSSLNASTKTASRMSQTGGHTQSPTPHGRRSSAGDAKATNSGTADDAATAPDDDEPPQQQRHTNVDMWRQHSEEALRFQAEPIRRMLMQDLAPELSAALLEVAGSRPEDPIEFIAQHLIKAGNAREEQYTDPYAADVYATQKQKWLLRQQREALL